MQTKAGPRLLLGGACALAVGCAGLLLLAALRGPALPLCAAAAALLLLAVAFWFVRRRTRKKKLPSEPPAWTVGDYFSRVPDGARTDFPVGPHLVLSLPAAPGVGTPCRKSLTKARKNLPPLASSETLTPSLISSCYGSISSVV